MKKTNTLENTNRLKKSNTFEKTNTLEKSDKFQILEEMLSEKEGQCVIWCTQLVTVDYLRTLLSTNYKVYVFTGALSHKQRETVVENFRGDKEGIFLATIQSAAEGLNLQTCNMMIFYEFSMVASVNEQAEGRCYRIGQKNNVLIYYLYAPGTIEEAILKMVRNKKDFNEFISENKKLTKDQINYLINNMNLKI